MEKFDCLCQTRIGVDCDSNHELLISKIKIKLKKGTKRFRVPKYNLNFIPEEFDDPIKTDLHH